MKKMVLLFFVIILTSLSFRLGYVQYNIAHLPLEISDIADAGYTHPSDFGHGNMYGENANNLWYIYDVPAPEVGEGKVRKICAYGQPNYIQTNLPQADIDFFHFSGVWYKLRTGDLTVTETNFTPPENIKWIGWLSSKSVFPINKPDFPYKLKIIYSKLWYGSLSPKEYVKGLKHSNPSCMDIPDI